MEPELDLYHIIFQIVNEWKTEECVGRIVLAMTEEEGEKMRDNCTESSGIHNRRRDNNNNKKPAKAKKWGEGNN